MTTPVTPPVEEAWWDEEPAAPQPRTSRKRARTRRRWPLLAGAAVLAGGAVTGGVLLAGHLTEPSLPSDLTYPAGLTGSQVTADSHGQYVQVTPTETSSILGWNGEAEGVDPLVLAMYDSTTLAQAQQFVARFLIEEGLDSPLVFDASPEVWDAWVLEHQDLFVHGLLEEPDAAAGPVVDTAARDFAGNPRGRSATADGDPQARLRDLDLHLVGVDLENAEDLRFEFVATYLHDVVDDEGTAAVSHNEHALSYTLTPDRENDSWLIAGWNNHFATFTDWSTGKRDPGE